MLAHSAHPYTCAAEERRENMPSCHPSDPSIVLKDYATRPRSIDLPCHASFTEDILPAPTRDEPVYGNPATKPYFYHVPQNQFQKSHSSGHRLVHPCMSISSQTDSQAHHASAFYGYQDPNIRSSAHQNPNSNSVYTLATHMAVQSRQQCPTGRTPTGLVANAYEDIESGLGSSSSSGKSSASSLVRGAGESVLAGFDWAGGKLANLFGVSQPKYQWAMDEHELLRKQAKSEVELDRLAKSAQFFEQRCMV